MTAAVQDASRMPRLSAAIRGLLEDRGLAATPVRFAAASATRVDTGGWLTGEPLWVAVVEDRLVLAAAGNKPYLLDLPISALAQAVYNHVTGAVVFRPGPAQRDIPPLRLDPLVARTLLTLATDSVTASPGTLPHA
ncbi:MAG: hypothetical protein ACKOC4_08105 [Planctomycetia bacterium]